ncbi:hypothetical protein WJX81_002280 [Elliptochloris bilobata]|uniref:RNA helicase n=1 Tax=Elliptochloris bilobata TaxID=381761 RepID=A0AAW1QHX2_9CHLO
MGVDYTTRKLAKKRRKSAIDPELESEGKHRRKSKRGRRAGCAAGTHRRRLRRPKGSDGAFAKWPEPIRRYMTGEGFEAPTPIQERAWRAALAGRDIQAVAEPGSGKTLGFLLPAAAALAAAGHNARTSPAGPLALVLVPTRELAAQVAAVGRTLQRTSGLRCAALYGGVERAGQVVVLQRRPHVVIATPGRLLDLADDSEIDLGGVAHVVLDEADKMLSLGLEPQLERLRALLLPEGSASARADDEGAERRAAGEAAGGPGARERPQVQLWTATMPDALRAAAARWLQRPRRLRALASGSAISRSVVQVVHVCAEHKKPAKLLKHLKQIQAAGEGQRNPPRVLIFVNRIKTARFVAGEVAAAGFRTALLHGDRPQAEREAAMRDFRSGKAQALVATDVAGRGLHIRNLPYVVNYDFPSRMEAYVHRVGRTGRLAAAGHAYSFFTRALARLAPPLLALLQEHGQDVDPNFVRLAEAAVSFGGIVR